MQTCLTGNRTIVWQRSYRQIHLAMESLCSTEWQTCLLGNRATVWQRSYRVYQGKLSIKIRGNSLLACYWMATGLLLAISGLRLAEMLKDWQA